MHKELNLDEEHKEWHGTLRSYLTGFLLSLFFTGIAFSLAMTRLFSGHLMTFTLVSLGILQAIGQALFFLHVGKESKPRWKFLVFLFMILVLLIVAIGSIWIIFDLNVRVMPWM